MITGEVRTIYISSQDNGEQSGTTLHNGIGRKDVKEGLFMLVLYAQVPKTSVNHDGDERI